MVLFSANAANSFMFETMKTIPLVIFVTFWMFCRSSGPSVVGRPVLEAERRATDGPPSPPPSAPSQDKHQNVGQHRPPPQGPLSERGATVWSFKASDEQQLNRSDHPTGSLKGGATPALLHKDLHRPLAAAAGRAGTGRDGTGV